MFSTWRWRGIKRYTVCFKKLNIEYLVISRRSKFDYKFLKKNN